MDQRSFGDYLLVEYTAGAYNTAILCFSESAVSNFVEVLCMY